jgi:hypothetical protein
MKDAYFGFKSSLAKTDTGFSNEIDTLTKN